MKSTCLIVAVLFFSISSAFSQNGEEEGFRLLRDTLQKDPHNSELLYLRGMAYRETHDYSKAIADLSTALKYLQKTTTDLEEDKPADSIEILNARATCYDQLGALDSAVRDYRYLQQLKPSDFKYSISVSRLYIKHRLFKKAQIEIDRLVSSGNNERGLSQQAILYLEEKNYSKAISASDIALKNYPAGIESLITKARALYALKNYTEACATIKKAASEMKPAYFGNEPGYMRDFETTIEHLKIEYCK